MFNIKILLPTQKTKYSSPQTWVFQMHDWRATAYDERRKTKLDCFAKLAKTKI